MKPLTGRDIPKQTTAGVLLFALSAALLAVDVVATRAEDSGRLPLPTSASTAAPLVAAATCPAMPRTPTSIAHGSASLQRRLPKEHAIVRAAFATLHTAPKQPSPVAATARFAVIRPVSNEGRSTMAAARALPTPASGHRIQFAAVSALRGTPGPATRTPHVDEPRPTRMPSLASATGNAPARAAAPTPLALSAAKAAAHRTAVQAAQFYVVHVAKAQIHELRSLSAVTRKRGPDRFVANLTARTRTGTLLEYEVLRRNGIGFAVESRIVRVVVATPADGRGPGSLADFNQGP